MTDPMQRKSRGFADMDAERLHVISSLGGRAVPKAKRAFSQNRKLAAEAGRKGGQSVPPHKRAFAQNRDLAVKAGRQGGTRLPPKKRSFFNDRELASRAGKTGGTAPHAPRQKPSATAETSWSDTAPG